MEAAQNSIENIVTYVTGGFKLLVLGLIAYVVFKMLHKFNILGTSEETEEAKLLSQDVALSKTTSDLISNPENPFLKAIHKKFGAHPTPKQLDSLIPNKSSMPGYISQINEAHNFFSPNDASKIFAVFRNFVSQYEVNFFATLYAVQQKQDMYGKLDKLMHDSDMATLRQIINSKPLI